MLPRLYRIVSFALEWEKKEHSAAMSFTLDCEPSGLISICTLYFNYQESNSSQIVKAQHNIWTFSGLILKNKWSVHVILENEMAQMNCNAISILFHSVKCLFETWVQRIYFNEVCRPFLSACADAVLQQLSLKRDWLLYSCGVCKLLVFQLKKNRIWFRQLKSSIC